MSLKPCSDIGLLKRSSFVVCRAPNPISPPNEVSNHQIHDAFISPVNKGVTEEQSLSKPTLSSEDVVELKKSKASAVPVAVSVSDSAEQSDTQISQKYRMVIATSSCPSQSDQGKDDLYLCSFKCTLHSSN